jgi:cell wall-associated NlpC family hydrolase
MYFCDTMKLAFLFLLFPLLAHKPAGDEFVNKIINDGKAYLGYKYRHRVSTGHVFDCSGFIAHILEINGIAVSRGSASISKEVEVITLDDARPGDLLFFKGRDMNINQIGHVAMVVERDGNKIFMIHATRRGIVIDEFKSDYYVMRFVHAGRLPILFKASPNSGQIPDEEPVFESPEIH